MRMFHKRLTKLQDKIEDTKPSKKVYVNISYLASMSGNESADFQAMVNQIVNNSIMAVEEENSRLRQEFEADNKRLRQEMSEISRPSNTSDQGERLPFNNTSGSTAGSNVMDEPEKTTVNELLRVLEQKLTSDSDIRQETDETCQEYHIRLMIQLKKIVTLVDAVQLCKSSEELKQQMSKMQDLNNEINKILNPPLGTAKADVSLQSNLMDVQERHITNRICRDSGVHGQFDRSSLLWEMTVVVGGVCSLTSEVLANLTKGMPPPAYFDCRGWFRAGLPFFQGDMTLRCSALILPHGF
ncbi:hypothetical protein J6590_080015 [Homalodisca vitripennis]|nr:hypothetical protein J6590_080015 [Homalodisca vitripennis]